jgi:hypothetical protein
MAPLRILTYTYKIKTKKFDFITVKKKAKWHVESFILKCMQKLIEKKIFYYFLFVSSVCKIIQRALKFVNWVIIWIKAISKLEPIVDSINFELSQKVKTCKRFWNAFLNDFLRFVSVLRRKINLFRKIL